MNALSSPNPKLVIKKVIPAKREAVFDAWTKPELMQKWFFPGNWSAKISNELKIGGQYSNTMISDGSPSSCATESKAESYLHTGEYIEILRPERLVFTWNSPIITDSRVTVEFKDMGSSTELTLTHELLQTEELKIRHNQGWDGCLANLERFLS